MSRKGYTLVELLVVVAIMGILSTMVIMNFGTYLDNRKLDTEAYKVHSFISGYKVESYKTETPYYFKHRGGTVSEFRILEVFNSDSSGAVAVDSYDIQHNSEMPIDSKPMATGVYMSITAPKGFSSTDAISVNPLSLGYELPNDNDSVTLVIKHGNLESNAFTITFYDEQARVRFAKNGKDL